VDRGYTSDHALDSNEDMKKHSAAAALLILLCTIAPISHAGDSLLIIESSAIDKALREQFFTDKGRYWLNNLDTCNQAYLESPSAQIAAGRVRLRATFNGRIGAKAGDKCLGSGDNFVVVTSGKPFYRDGRIGLEDIRIDSLSNEFYRLLLQPMVSTLMPGLLDVNLKDAALQALAGRTGPYQTDIENLTVSELSADADKLSLRLQFTLRVR
jgi:hypothetical protein